MLDVREGLKMDTTILYYTADVEQSSFANKVRDNILSLRGDLPILSVSQVPLDFGNNICVGRVGRSYHNEFRQIQIGLREVKTKYILVAEADTLYPPDYFTKLAGNPGSTRFHGNVWVLYRGTSVFLFKSISHAAQLIDARAWLNRLTASLEGQPKWSLERPPVHNQQFPSDYKTIWGEQPVITFKTEAGVGPKTQVKKAVEPVGELPYWGTAVDLHKRMFNEV